MADSDKWWERESKESVLSGQLDDYDHLYLKPFVKIELVSEAFVQITFCQGLRMQKLLFSSIKRVEYLLYLFVYLFPSAVNLQDQY